MKRDYLPLKTFSLKLSDNEKQLSVTSCSLQCISAGCDKIYELRWTILKNTGTSRVMLGPIWIYFTMSQLTISVENGFSETAHHIHIFPFPQDEKPNYNYSKQIIAL